VKNIDFLLAGCKGKYIFMTPGDFFRYNALKFQQQYYLFDFLANK